MKLTMLGTGNAFVTECYNTCFVISNDKGHFMVDAGGGSAILKQLKDAGIKWQDVRHIFVTHKHIDHLMGMIWMMRIITQNMKQGQYDGEAYIYGHDEVIALLMDMATKLLPAKEVSYIGNRLHLITLSDGQEFTVIGNNCTAFDIQSTKARQFGFVMYYGDKKLTCCGDEPYNECEKQYAEGSDWLLHEAFCLYSQADIFKPYEKHHSTAKDAGKLASELGVKNLLLYHTEDRNITNRKELYTREARETFEGNIYVPDDLEIIEL